MLTTVHQRTQRHPGLFMGFVVLVCFGLYTFVPAADLLGLFLQTLILGVFILCCLFVWNPASCIAPTTTNTVFTFRKTAYLLALALTFGAVSTVLIFIFQLNIELSQLRYIPLLFLCCLFTGIFEESLFRGLFFPFFAHELRHRQHGITLAALASALLFGFLHVSGDLATSNMTDIIIIAQALMKTAQASIFGFFMAALFFTTKNIWTVAVVHGLYNLFTMWPALFFSENHMSTYLTGSLADLITLTVLVVAFIPLIPTSLKLLSPSTKSE